MLSLRRRKRSAAIAQPRERQRSQVPRCILRHNVLRDITDALINVSNERKADDKIVTLSNEKIIITVNDIFGAGFGTLSSCLQWIFLYLTNNPEIQMKIQEEIDGKNGQRPPKFEDRKDLHYTEAFINEVFRHSSFIPFTIPHWYSASTVICPST